MKWRKSRLSASSGLVNAGCSRDGSRNRPQEAADDLPDGNATRDQLLDFASDTEDWFQARFSRELL
jgi:hypothetical protein